MLRGVGGVGHEGGEKPGGGRGMEPTLGGTGQLGSSKTKIQGVGVVIRKCMQNAVIIETVPAQGP